MRVRDLMSKPVVTIGPSDSCQEAVARMHRARVRHLPVINVDGDLVGVVTDRDLRHHLFSPRVFKELGATSVDVILRAVPVSAIMSTDVISAEADADLGEAARTMLEEKVGSLPVLDRGRLAGILTETDLLRHICCADAYCSPEVAEIVVSYP